MKPQVTAVVIAHGQPEHLQETLAGLDSQTTKCDQVVIVDTSSDESCGPVIDAFLSSTKLTSKIRADEKTRLPTSLELAIKNLEASEDHWIWLLHDDSAPEKNALEEMLKTIEISPSVAMVGPKLVNWDQPRIIAQMGLSLTPLGNPISPYSAELDQGQHDSIDDVFAIGTAGALVRSSVYRTLGGLDPNSPELAADIDLSIRMRLAGYRVVLAPKAKVRHASLSLSGKRPKGWLRTTPRTALRRATIHLRLAHSPLPVAILFWLLLDELSILRSLWHIASKRPQLIWSEISAGIWGIFDIARAFRSRALAAKSKRLPFSTLKPLRATWPQVFAAARKQADREETIAKLNAFAQADDDAEDAPAAKSFIASGGLWLSLALLAIGGLAAFPSNVALVGPGANPLSAKWLDLFSNAGASYQHLGFGLAAPADPFTWVLLGLGSLTFWAPSLGVALLVFAARPLAFAGAWKFLGVVTHKTWVKNLAALLYALVPALSLAVAKAEVASVVVFVALPWLAYSLAKAAGWGDSTTSNTSPWTWVGASGILLAITAAASPSLGLALIACLGLVVFLRIKRIGYLMWVALPVAALFTPSVVYALANLSNPLAVLADPGLNAEQPALESVWLLATANGWLALAWLAVAAVALLALLTKRAAAASVFWVFALIGLVGVWALQNVKQLDSTLALQPLNLEPWLSLMTLGLIAATAIALATLKAPKLLGPSFTVVALAPLVVIVLTTPLQYSFSDGRVAPSIVAAEAAGGSELKTLEVDPVGPQELKAAIVWGDGTTLDELNVAYRYSLAKANQSDDDRSKLAALVANLASANGTPVLQQLNDFNIGYVLIPKDESSVASELGLAFDSIAELEPVGATDFGRLWRVRDAAAASTPVGEPPLNALWSITKAVQLTVLGGFLLLALPTGRSRRKKAQDSELFDGQFGTEANA